MSMHEGHRERLRDRYKNEGLDNFAPVNVLELLLFYCIPRKDTNPIAHRLLDTFGSLAAVLDAEPEALMKVEGVSQATALFLTMLPDAFRYYRKDANTIKLVQSIEDCSEYLSDYFIGQTEEVVYLLCLDAKCKIICCREISRGNGNSAMIYTPKILEIAVNVKARSVILAHNHPGGLAVPSGEDLNTTKMVAMALNAANIELADHMIFCEDESVSIRASGYFDRIMMG